MTLSTSLIHSLDIPAHHHLVLVVLVQGVPETGSPPKVIRAGLHELSDVRHPAVGDGLGAQFNRKMLA